MHNFFRKDQGFTLFELLVVIVISGNRAAIAIPVFLSQPATANLALLRGRTSPQSRSWFRLMLPTPSLRNSRAWVMLGAAVGVRDSPAGRVWIRGCGVGRRSVVGAGEGVGMRRPRFLVVLLAVVGLVMAACGSVSQSSSPAVTSLWVVTATGGTIAGVGDDTGSETLTVTLTGVRDHATQFTDRPARDAYVMSTADFVDRWRPWFADSPPNAVLSFLEAGDAMPHAIVLVVDDPVYDEAAETVTFAAQHVHRQPDPHPDAIEAVTVPSRRPPQVFMSASLFIDTAQDPALDGKAPGGTGGNGGTGGRGGDQVSPGETLGASAGTDQDPSQRPGPEPSGSRTVQPDAMRSSLVDPDTQPSSLDGDGGTGRCSIERDGLCNNDPGDLANRDFSDLDLQHMVFLDVNLSGCDFSRTRLVGGRLTDVNLSGANLAGAFLSGANLSGVDLSGANLTDAFLTGATLSGVNLTNADLTDADLWRAELTNADFTGANLSGARWIDRHRCATPSIGACR